MYLGYSDIKELLPVVDEKTGVVFSRYGLSFFRRRLSFVLDKLLVKKKQQFVELLDDPQFVDRFCYNMSVPVAELFRDPAYWRLMKKIIPQRYPDKINVWFPDISSGEELYGLLIVLSQLGLLDKAAINVQHSSQAGLDAIASGIVTPKMDEINRSNFERTQMTGSFDDYFAKSDFDCKINADLMRNVTFEKKWFLNDVSETKYDLIFFRNNSLLFGKELQDDVFAFLHTRLNANGLLSIGIKDSLPASAKTLYALLNADEQVYMKN